MASMIGAKQAAPHPHGDRSLTLPCDCGCQIVVISEWLGEDDALDEAFVEFYTSYRQDGWRERIKQAWATLRGKPYYHCVAWNEDQLTLLKEWLIGMDLKRRRGGGYVEH